jgi:hypothetical protein
MALSRASELRVCTLASNRPNPYVWSCTIHRIRRATELLAQEKDAPSTAFRDFIIGQIQNPHGWQNWTCH